MNSINLFQGLLGIRQLIAESVRNDRFIAHYITHIADTDDMFEVTLFANNGQSPQMIWSYKFIIPYAKLLKLLKLVYKMIALEDKKGLKLN